MTQLFNVDSFYNPTECRRLLAQAGHDLRQPMQALNLFISALAEENLDAPQRQLVQRISASAANLKTLLDNMLDIGKLDAGGFIPELKNFDIGELICRLCREYRYITAAQNIKILCRLRHFYVFSDEVLLERIIRNLMGNALKYTKNKILLSCTKEHGLLKIRIADNGIGIAKAERQKIFEEFYQNKNIEGNRTMGAGLGLNIIKRIADLLGANIKIRSRVGEYTIFEVSLPL